MDLILSSRFGLFSASFFFLKQVYPWGSILEKNTLDTLVGALGLVGRGFGPAGRAGLGWAWGFAVLGAAGLGVVSLGWVRRGVGRAGRTGWVRRGVGRAGRTGWVRRVGRAGWIGRGVGRGLAVLGALGWVGRGVWPCWARWLGWAWCSK